VRQDACERLAALGDTLAVPALISMLDDELLEWTAARGLGVLKDARAIPALRDHVRLNDGGVNRMAVWALGELGDTGSVRVLKQLLEERAAEYRVDSAAVASVIRRLRSPRD